MVKNWKELIGYVNVGNIQIDNNCCERAVRPFTNLRKSFGGFSSENGARTAATILSFVETCKLMKKMASKAWRHVLVRGESLLWIVLMKKQSARQLRKTVRVCPKHVRHGRM